MVSPVTMIHFFIKKFGIVFCFADIENAIFFECSNLMREAENLLRISIGAKKIGEGHISETELFYKLNIIPFF